MLMSLILSGLLCHLNGTDSLLVVVGIDCQFAGLSSQVRLPAVLSTKLLSYVTVIYTT